MLLFRIILLTGFLVIAKSFGGTDPPAELPQLLEELDHAGLVQDMPSVAALIAKWKRLEPTAAAPWLKEMALLQMTASADAEGCIDVLRKGLKTLPTNKTLRARLAGACAVNQRPQEALKHYRWLFEHAGGVHEKLSWVIQMKLVDFLEDEVHDPIKRQRPAAREVGGAGAMAGDKCFVAQTLTERGDEWSKIIWNGNQRPLHPKDDREASCAVRS